MNVKTCRACLSASENMVPLDELFVNNYNSLTNLNISLYDGMPQHSCKTCVNTLKDVIDFREKCILSEIKLRETAITDVKLENTLTALKTEALDIKVENDYEDYSRCDDYLPYQLENISNYLQLSTDSKDIDDIQSKKSRKSRLKKKDKLKQEEECKSSYVLLCGLCRKAFDDQNMLNIHMDTHKTDRTCSICQEHFQNWPQLLAHRLMHLPIKQRRCHICSKRFMSFISLEFHYMSNHYEGEYSGTIKCKKCSSSYSSARKLLKHMSSEHSNNSFVCDICSKVFQNKSRLKLHLRSHNGNKAYVCDLCGFSCNYSSGMKDHKIRKHAPMKCTCKNCKRVFKDEHDMEKHKCRMSLRVCPICGIMIDRSRRYNRHMETHEEVGKYKCDRCPATYKNKPALTEHINRHDGIRTRQCEFCPAKFYSATVLIKHRRIHTGEKPYVCKICQRSFTGNHNLKVHMKVHGEDLIVKKPKLDAVTKTE